MSLIQGHGHEALRRGRWSSPEAEYFLTVMTDGRRTGLEDPTLTDSILAVGRTMEAQGLWRLRTAVVMPDHLHLIVGLTGNADLSQSMKMLKGRSAVLLRSHQLRWQRGFFDHRMREREDRLPVFLYIFLNPYRARLLPVDQKWHGYFCAPDDWEWFEPLTSEACPFPEWLE
jgi:REP element-mobilizing transposase RayT